MSLLSATRTLASAQPLLNLGCGRRCHPDWTNLDINPEAPGVIRCDFTRHIPYADGSFAAAYCSHALEHLRKEDAPIFLAECRRVLQPGGILRLAVPDLEIICRLYLERLDAAMQGEPGAEAEHAWMTLELLDQAVRETSGGAMLQSLAQNPLPAEEFILRRVGPEAAIWINDLRRAPEPQPPKAQSILRWLWLRVRRAILDALHDPNWARPLAIGRFRMAGEVHHWMYDRLSLAQILKQAGFEDPKDMAAGESAIEGFATAGLELSPEGAVLKPDSLFMEAVRPCK